MIVKTIHGAGSHVESVDGNMLISNCNVEVEENLVEQLNDIKMVSSVIKLSDKIIFTNEEGEFTHIDKIKKQNNHNDFYKNEGIAIFVKGNLVYGIHPDNLESNLEALTKGDMKFDWEVIKNNYVK
jgi:hypothetical protein